MKYVLRCWVEKEKGLEEGWMHKGGNCKESLQSHASTQIAKETTNLNMLATKAFAKDKMLQKSIRLEYPMLFLKASKPTSIVQENSDVRIAKSIDIRPRKFRESLLKIFQDPWFFLRCPKHEEISQKILILKPMYFRVFFLVLCFENGIRKGDFKI